jgi:FMN phosphatase YigB (HAD superfamily)
MKKIILTDADGVLVNWNKGFESFMVSRGHPRIPGTDDEYSISLRHANVTNKQAHELITEFNECELISSLDAFADSVEYVNKLSDLGFRFIVVTSISDHPNAKVFRTQNLTNLFGDVFDEINCITMGASKANILMNWADDGFFWIEDHMRQAEAGHEAGLKTVLISHSYNSHYKTDLFPTVSNETPWREIYELVCAEYKI